MNLLLKVPPAYGTTAQRKAAAMPTVPTERRDALLLGNVDTREAKRGPMPRILTPLPAANAGITTVYFTDQFRLHLRSFPLLPDDPRFMYYPAT